MIFEEIVTEVCERLNLTSDEAKSRVGREVNSRYRRATSSIGLETSRRSRVTFSIFAGEQTATISDCEKVLLVMDPTDPKRPIILKQVTPDELYILPTKSSTPRHFAITDMSQRSVGLKVDAIDEDNVTLLAADVLVAMSTLAGGASPDFPESFHDILIFGAMADEYKRLEKMPFAQDAELNYEKRLSDLRMWIAKSGYLDIEQGKYNNYRTTLGLPLNGSGNFI